MTASDSLQSVETKRRWKIVYKSQVSRSAGLTYRDSSPKCVFENGFVHSTFARTLIIEQFPKSEFNLMKAAVIGPLCEISPVEPATQLVPTRT